VPPVIFRKGLDLKHEVAGVLAESYHSALVQQIKDNNYRYESGRLTIHLAREFGFCYGVDRAVDYAYQARRRFPDRTVYLTGEIEAWCQEALAVLEPVQAVFGRSLAGHEAEYAQILKADLGLVPRVEELRALDDLTFAYESR
jgi:4-hydroxy-3-methylbut-2-enyl diphosphate reductase